MANMLLREIDEHVVNFLKTTAKKNKRSVNGEILSILEQAASSHPGRLGAMERIQKLSNSFKPSKGSATKLVREVRGGSAGWES